MFYNCSSLTTLPDISKWNTWNAMNMGFMFYNCSSLTWIVDISNWSTGNIRFKKFMFKGCINLLKQRIPNKFNDDL